LSAGDRQAIESATEALKKAIESNDTAAINKSMEDLTQAQHKAAASLYQQASSAPGGGGATGGGHAPGGEGGATGDAAGGGSSKSGDVIDAEVVDDK